MPDGTGAERISVSRETLRAELAEMELRLTRYTDNHIDVLKASLMALENQIQIQDRINEALAVKAKETQEKSASNFTKGEKIFAAVMGMIALAIQFYVVGGFG